MKSKVSLPCSQIFTTKLPEPAGYSFKIHFKKIVSVVNLRVNWGEGGGQAYGMYGKNRNAYSALKVNLKTT